MLITQLGWIIGYLFTFVVVGLHLGSYFLPWVIYSGIAGSILVFLQAFVGETLPKKLHSGLRMSMFNPFRGFVDTFSFMYPDRFLLLIMLNNVIMYVHFVGFITLSSSYMVRLGFGLQEMLLPGLCMPAMQVLVLGFTSKYQQKIGTMNLYVCGQTAFFLGYVFYGPGIFIGHAAPYIASLFLGTGLSPVSLSVSTTVSTRISDAHQARCQATIGLVSKIGAAIGPPIWNSVLFDGTATSGFHFILPPFASMLVAVVTTMLALYMRARQDAYPPVQAVQQLMYADVEKQKKPIYGSTS
jgi:hypothetical protein